MPVQIQPKSISEMKELLIDLEKDSSLARLTNAKYRYQEALKHTNGNNRYVALWEDQIDINQLRLDRLNEGKSFEELINVKVDGFESKYLFNQMRDDFFSWYKKFYKNEKT